MRDPTGRSRGFAFLTFKSVESVHKVLAQNHQLDGKMASGGGFDADGRSTPSAPSRAQSTSGPPRSLSVVWRPV